MDIQNKERQITETSIGGTVYIVESVASDMAKETVYSKLKRLILSDLEHEIKLSESSKSSAETDSTSAN